MYKFDVIYYSHIYQPNTTMLYCFSKLWESVSANQGRLHVIAPITGYLISLVHEDIYTRILNGLSKTETNYVFLAEHDVIYNSKYYDFMLKQLINNPEKLIYNTNIVVFTKRGYHYSPISGFNEPNILSNLCANTEMLKVHIKNKLDYVIKTKDESHIEPGKEGEFIKVKVPIPTIDIRSSISYTGDRIPSDNKYLFDIPGIPSWKDINSVVFD